MAAYSDWLRWAKAGGLSDETIKGYSRELLAFFGTTAMPWDRLTLTELTAYSSTLAPGRGRIAFAALNNFAKWMKVAGVSDYDPGLALFPHQKQRKRVPTCFTQDEIRRLNEAGDWLSPRHGAICRVLYL